MVAMTTNLGSPVLGQATTSCPDCGHDGPHDVYIHLGEAEYVCAGCGIQHVAPDDASTAVHAHVIGERLVHVEHDLPRYLATRWGGR